MNTTTERAKKIASLRERIAEIEKQIDEATEETTKDLIARWSSLQDTLGGIVAPFADFTNGRRDA